MRTLICFFCGLLFCLSAFALQTKSQIRVTLPEGWTKVAGSVLEHQYLKNGASFMIKEETALNGKGLSEAVLIARKQLGQFLKVPNSLTMRN